MISFPGDWPLRTGSVFIQETANITSPKARS